MKKSALILIFLFLIDNSYSQNIYELIEYNNYDKVNEYAKSLNVYNSSQTTPLMWAIYKSDLKMVELLISKGADPRMKSWLQSQNYLCGSNFVMAAWAGKLDILKYFLKNKYFSIDEKEFGFYNKDIKNGWNALQTAAYKNNVEIVRYLVKQGADINSLAETNANQTPLLMALNYGNIDVAFELIQLGADVNIRDVYYNSSMELALNLRNRELVKKIYESSFHFRENREQEFIIKLKKYFGADSFEFL